MNARRPASADDYVGAFWRVASLLPGQGLGWLQHARQAAIERFAARGFPTLRDEAWKYTSVGAIEQTRFNVLPAPCPNFLAPVVDRLALPAAHLLVFVNGRLEPGLCHLGRPPHGVVLGSLAYRLEQGPSEQEAELLSAEPASSFEDLNLAMAADGAYVRLPPGAVVDGPIQLLYIATDPNLATQPRNLLLASEDSAADIVEQHVALGAVGYLSNAVTDIVLDPGARIAHYKLQQESPAAFHIATVNAAQAAGSRFVSGAYAFGARLARVAIGVRLQAEGAACTLDGLYVAEGRQHIDHHTRVDHLHAHCTSRELYKGILNGAARAVFNGRVVVHADAQGSDAFQANHNLLLSDNAEVDTKPQLEIWADDVKCSHGATVGQLDADQLFYLCSRGIGREPARALLTRAFAGEMVQRIEAAPLRDRLDALLQDRLPLH